jgi:hypothetical protein
MADRPKSPSEQARSQRLSKALRDNLKRRKAQLRGRDVAKTEDKAPNPASKRQDR